MARKYVLNKNTGPAFDFKSVTPNDSTDLPDGPCRGIWVGVAGDVKINTPSGTTIVVPALIAGMVHPIAATRIWSGSTTATTILAVY